MNQDMADQDCWQSQAGAAGIELADYVERLLLAEPRALGRVAARLALAALDPQALRDAKPRFDLLALHDALALRVLPVEIGGAASLVLADPLARATREALQARFPAGPIDLAMSLPGEVDRLLGEFESSKRVMDDAAVDTQGDSLAQAVESITLASIANDQSPIIRLVNMTLYDALQGRASDIHLEASQDGLHIRYRIDGVLQSIRRVPGVEVAVQAMSRLKVLATLDIAEKRVPQDGRFKAVLQGREIDFRVSIMPGTHGENAVLRILDRSQRGGEIRLDGLGFDAGTAQRIRALAQRPYGLLLVTGPTGSGKSTTLYAVLSEVGTGGEKIITIEDPVEYELDGVLQIPVNERKGLGFARGLRSILRHDPDTVMVGEIRDAETAAIAVQSALTGHRVFSTVHANDGFSVIDRFIYMGVEPSTFLEALNGVVSQRLVRRICPACGHGADTAARRGAFARLSVEALAHAVEAGPGCESCRGTGYHGRLALAEVLPLDEPIKAALLARSIDKRVRALAANPHYLSMREAGLAAIRQGLTTFQEVQRAIALA